MTAFGISMAESYRKGFQLYKGKRKTNKNPTSGQEKGLRKGTDATFVDFFSCPLFGIRTLLGYVWIHIRRCGFRRE